MATFLGKILNNISNFEEKKRKGKQIYRYIDMYFQLTLSPPVLDKNNTRTRAHLAR